MDTIQRQNDQLSLQVAEAENENLTLRQVVEELNSQVTQKRETQADLAKSIESLQSTASNTVAPPTPKRSNGLEQLGLLIGLFFLFLAIGFVLA